MDSFCALTECDWPITLKVSQLTYDQLLFIHVPTSAGKRVAPAVVRVDVTVAEPTAAAAQDRIEIRLACEPAVTTVPLS